MPQAVESQPVRLDDSAQQIFPKAQVERQLQAVVNIQIQTPLPRPQFQIESYRRRYRVKGIACVAVLQGVGER